MSATRDRLSVPETPEERAWTIWCDRGVVVPAFAAEIGERRRIHRRWVAVDDETDDDEIGAADAEEIEAVVVESDDGAPDACMLFPAEANSEQLASQWISAYDAGFADPAVVQ